MSGWDESFAHDHDHAVAQANEAVATLHRVFLATPYRPTSLNTSARTIVRLVDEVNWLSAIVVQSARPAEHAPVNRPACAVKVASAAVLEQGSDLLDVIGGDCTQLQAALAELTGALGRMEESATSELPVRQAAAPAAPPPASKRGSLSASSSPRSIRASERRS
jgi:hypothetical protein